MNMMETMIGIALAAVMVATMLEWSDDHTQESEAQLVATTLDELNAGAKHYMQSEFETLAECMALATHVNKWADAFEDDHPGVGGMTYGREASAWYAIPLYDNNAGLADPNWRAARSECGDDPWAITSAPLGWPPSLFETGFLPTGLQGLRHTANADDETWGTRGLRLRLYLRWVNTSRRNATAGSPARPVLESMLVAGTEAATTLSRNLVQRVMRASTTADVGAVTSQAVGTVVTADTQVYGVNGGWDRELCLRSTSVTQGSILDCARPAGALTHEPNLDADVIPLDFNSSGSGRVENRGEPFLATTGTLPTDTELSGKGTADSVEMGRLVYMGMMRPEAKLADMLYRRDVGVPELNRMETDLNFGGYGGLNAAFFAGIDIDGDGVPDEGLHIVGPPVYEDIDDDGTVTAAERAAGVERRKRPTVVHGDLTVLGNLQVGGEEPAFGANALGIEKAQTVGGEFTTGNVHAFGSMHLGPGEFDAKTLRRGETTAEITAGHLLVTGSTQIGGLEFDQGITTGTGMSTHPGSLLVAANAQVGLEKTATGFGPTKMHPTLAGTNRWNTASATWDGSGSWTVASSAQGVVWSRHVVVSAADAPFVSSIAKEGRLIAEHGVRIGGYPNAWTEDDDINDPLGGLEVRAGTKGRDALLAVRHRPAPTTTPPTPGRSEIVSTNVPGQSGRQDLELIAQRDGSPAVFEQARIIMRNTGTTAPALAPEAGRIEIEGLNVWAKASEALELHAGITGGVGATKLKMDNLVDGGAELTAEKNIIVEAVEEVLVQAVGILGKVFVSGVDELTLQGGTAGGPPAGVASKIIANASGVDVDALGDVTVDAENIELNALTKFTWTAPNIDIIAAQNMLLKAGGTQTLEGGGLTSVVSRTADVEVYTGSAGKVKLQEGTGGETWIKKLETAETTLTDAPSGMETLEKALPSLVTRETRVVSSTATPPSSNCNTGETAPFMTAPHHWRRTRGAMEQDDINFIYVTSVALTTSGNTITATSTRQQTRFRAYLHPWTGWSAGVNALTGALSDNGTPAAHIGTVGGEQMVLCYK